MYRNIFLVGGWTVASRLTGFLRDMALAALMGGGALNDAYVAAIKLPNQFRGSPPGPSRSACPS